MVLSFPSVQQPQKKKQPHQTSTTTTERKPRERDRQSSCDSEDEGEEDERPPRTEEEASDSGQCSAPEDVLRRVLVSGPHAHVGQAAANPLHHRTLPPP